MKKVLVITYYFPPRPEIASVRLRGLAKYLPAFDWEPVVLTATLPGPPEPRFSVVQTPYPGDATARFKKKVFPDPTRGLLEQVGVEPTTSKGKYSHASLLGTLARGIVAYPDDQKGWCPFAVEAGCKLIDDLGIDAIISSSAPVTTHIIAKQLKARYSLPWIADLRDLWTQNHYYTYGPFRKWLERRLEIETLAQADSLVTVSEPLAQTLSTLHYDKPVYSIPNGFDSDEVEPASLTKEFTITYSGTLYQGMRDPKPLLKALNNLIGEGAMDPNTIRVRFFGPSQYWLEQEIKKYHLERVVSQCGVVPREIALANQRESHILLLLNWTHPAEAGVYTGKIFEYLAAQRPILALGGLGGVVKELLEKTSAGIHVSKPEELERALLNYYSEYRSTGKIGYHGLADHIQEYSHRKMAAKFAQVLEGVTSKDPERKK